MTNATLPSGVLRCKLNRENIAAVWHEVQSVLVQRPLWRPKFKSGAPFRYTMTCCGKYGWLADENGYRYTRAQENGEDWPALPSTIERLAVNASKAAGVSGFRPETCLINYYADFNSRLGLHQDDTENNLSAPIVSFSLGASGLFLLGGHRRTDPVQEVQLDHGDCLVMFGSSRMRFHGYAGNDSAFDSNYGLNGRYALTIRQVDT